jgi:hypothetical protein
LTDHPVRYEFSQKFRKSAPDAFAWCIDYDEKDPSLMGDKGKRKVTWVSGNVAILEDSLRGESGKRITKTKLVHIYPEERFWSSVHLTGPSKYSQFLYEIVEEGKNSSRLDFTGFQVTYHGKIPSKAESSALAKKLQREDSASWKKLAAAMEKDLA